MSDFTDHDKYEVAMREVRMRQKVYPRWIASGKIAKGEADRQLAIMEAIANDYRAKGLFDD